MKKDIDWDKVKFAACATLWSGIVSYLGQPLIHGNQDAINVIVTVFSILAGFLIAIITLIGDPKSMPAGSWQVARLGSERMYVRLHRQKWLFTTYLVTLLFIFISMVIKNEFPVLRKGIEYTYMFLSSFACIMSFRLPSTLIELQKERIEQEIEARKIQESVTIKKQE